MYYNELKEVAKKPTLLASLMGFINPVTIIPAIALGAVVLAVKRNNRLKNENEQLLASKNTLVKRTQVLEDELEDYYDAEYEELDEESDEPLSQPLNSSEPAEMLVTPTVEATVANGTINGAPTVENMTDEALKKEMMRQAMSELGKRSAAARAKKKRGEN